MRMPVRPSSAPEVPAARCPTPAPLRRLRLVATVALAALVTFTGACSSEGDPPPGTPVDGGTPRPDSGVPLTDAGPQGPVDAGGEPQPAFQVRAASELALSFAPNSPTDVTVTVVREPPFSGEVAVSLEGLPTQVRADAVTLTLSGAQGLAEFRLHVDELATYGRFPVTVVGQGNGERVEHVLTLDIQPGQAALDTSFGAGGLGLPALGHPAVSINAMAVQPDGKWILVGSTGSVGLRDVLVARLLPDGTPDLDFGVQGTRVTDICGGDDSVDAVLVLSDGRILVAGGAIAATGGCTGTKYQSALFARFTASGELDSTLGGTGVRTFQLSPGASALHAVTVDSQGRIVGVGAVQQPEDRDLLLMRLLPTGALDTTFSGDGAAWEDLGEDEEGRGVVTLPDDRILLMGTATGSRNGLTLRRYGVNGTRDASFDYSPPAYVTPRLTPRTLHLLENGKLLVGARAVFGAEGTDTSAALLQVNATGTGDSSFGTDGYRYLLAVENVARDVLVGTGLLPSGDIALVTFNKDLSGAPGLGLIHVSADAKRVLRTNRTDLPGSERPLLARLDAEGFFRVAGNHSDTGQAGEVPFLARFWPY